MSSAGIGSHSVGEVPVMPVVAVGDVAVGGGGVAASVASSVPVVSATVATVVATHLHPAADEIPENVGFGRSSMGGFNAANWLQDTPMATTAGSAGGSAIAAGSTGSAPVVLSSSPSSVAGPSYPTSGIFGDQRDFYARNRTAVIVSAVALSIIVAIAACFGIHYASHLSMDAQNALFAATAISGLALYMIGTIYLSAKRHKEEAVEMQESMDRSAHLSTDENGRLQQETIKAEILGRTNALERHPGKILGAALIVSALVATLVWFAVGTPSADFDHVISFFQKVAPQEWKAMAITSGAIVGGAALFGTLTGAGLYVKEKKKVAAAAAAGPTFWENYGSKIKIVAGVALLASGLAVGLALKHLNVDAKVAMIVAGSVSLVGIALFALIRHCKEKEEELEVAITKEAANSGISRELARDIVMQKMNQAHSGWKIALLVAAIAIAAFGAIYLPVHFHLHPEDWDVTKAAFVSAWNHTVEFFQGVYNPAIRQFFESHGWAMLETAGGLTGAALLIDGIVKYAKEKAEQKRQEDAREAARLAQLEADRIHYINSSRQGLGLPPVQGGSEVLTRITRRDTREVGEITRAKANWGKLKEPHMLAGVTHIMKRAETT